MSQTLNYHIPALLQPTIAGLNIRPDGTYVDATFGGGGHSRAIILNLNEHGRLFSFDQDMDAYENETNNTDRQPLLMSDPRWQFVHGNFRYLSNFLDYYHVETIDGLLADLGVSFHHFDSPERGFSFRFAGPLDMRMNRNARLSAADIVNTSDEETLSRILYLYGEIKNSRSLARTLCRARDVQPILRTEQLVEAVLRHPVGQTNGELDIPAAEKKELARIFQALRIEVNDEMGALRQMLTDARDRLAPGGRIAILTYHSLEDRLVKNFLRSGNLEGTIEKDFYGNILSPFTLIEKGLTADENEIANNPRSRSAKLRVAEKKQN